jgi:hypothetical protein
MSSGAPQILKSNNAAAVAKRMLPVVEAAARRFPEMNGHMAAAERDRH